MNLIRSSFFAVILVLLTSQRAHSEDQQFTIQFKDHHFEPQYVEFAANQKIHLKIQNMTGEAIEFESFSLDREKSVPPNGSIDVYLPALSPGKYDFYDDFHKDVPEGAIVVK